MTEKRVKLNKTREFIGDKLNEVKNEQPITTSFARMDLTPLLELSENLSQEGKKVAMTSFFLKILAIVLKEIPVLNSTLEGDEIVYHSEINTGIATLRDEGLIVLVLRSIQDKTLFEIDNEFRDLLSRMKENLLTVDDIKGGTVTFSNLSKSNMQIYTSIINNREAMITGLGGIYKDAIVLDDGTISARDVAYVSINSNHRMMDAGPPMKYLERVDEILKDPGHYLLK